jgi:hypothetical protein
MDGTASKVLAPGGFALIIGVWEAGQVLERRKSSRETMMTCGSARIGRGRSLARRAKANIFPFVTSTQPSMR